MGKGVGADGDALPRHTIFNHGFHGFFGITRMGEGGGGPPTASAAEGDFTTDLNGWRGLHGWGRGGDLLRETYRAVLSRG
jgi:hypothetical protein